MSVNSYRPSPDDDHLAVNTDILEDRPQRIARELLIPQIAKKTRNALNVVPYYAEHFQAIRSARRCSCFYASASVGDPEGLCPVCYGTGNVGGYQKRHCKVDVLDVTSPNVVMVNARPDFGTMSRPIHISMLETAVKAYIEFDLPVVTNIGVVDHLGMLDYHTADASITYSVKNANDVGFVALTEDNLRQRLVIGKPLRVRVDMKRASLQTKLPRFVAIRVSYRTQKFSALRCDIPRPTNSKTLEDFGIYNSTTPQQFVFSNELRVVENSDFFVTLHDGVRWKVTEYQANRILGINTSWDITCRPLQQFDVYSNIPLGRMDMLDTQMPPYAVRSMQTENEAYDSKGTTHDRLPGDAADAKKAFSVSVGVPPGHLHASSPTDEG